MSPKSREKAPLSITELLSNAQATFAEAAGAEQHNPDALTGAYTELEILSNQANAEGVLPTRDNFAQLVQASETAKYACVRAGDLTSLGYFVAKLQTYSSLQLTLAHAAETTPQPTATAEQPMSGGKHNVVN